MFNPKFIVDLSEIPRARMIRCPGSFCENVMNLDNQDSYEFRSLLYSNGEKFKELNIRCMKCKSDIKLIRSLPLESS